MSGRDMLKEHGWTSHPIIGYVALDQDGKPYQPRKGKDRWQRKNPPRIYKTMEMAVKQSPCNTASEVRMFTPNG